MINIEEKREVNSLQVGTIDLINDLFYWDKIEFLKVNYENHIGNRGEFEDKINLCLIVEFLFEQYKFEFYISYDQLEYYVSNKDGVIEFKCNMEDSSPANVMQSKFIDYLKCDIKKRDYTLY
ncbi:MAG: hypothetical protein AB7O47_11970 [Flavobacteriales bacterium]